MYSGAPIIWSPTGHKNHAAFFGCINLIKKISGPVKVVVIMR